MENVVEYVVVRIDGDSIELRLLFGDQLIKIPIQSIKAEEHDLKAEEHDLKAEEDDLIAPDDVVSFFCGIKEYKKDRVASEIYKNSFIDVFDPKKHDIENYKFIIILGELEGISNIDKELKPGQCLFIPFTEEEKTPMGNGWIDHYTYLRYSLSRYSFGPNPVKFLSKLSKCQDADDILSLLLPLGHAIFSNKTYTGAPKIGEFILTEDTSEDQRNTINTMHKSLSEKSFGFMYKYDNDEKIFYGENNIDSMPDINTGFGSM